jgi:glycosyltransferase involved in cell wall biosynthesis
MAHLNFLILQLKPLLPAGTRILVRQNTTASAASAASPISRLLYRHLYPRADRIICQSQSMADDLALNFHISPSKLVVLANPLDVEAIRSTLASTTLPNPWPAGGWPNLISVGRLAPEKGLDLLIQALVDVRPLYPNLLLSILGTGPEESRLRQMVTRLKLEENIHFAGFQASPAKWFASSDLFVLPSRYEGMPNALLEAAAAGLPLVATPCCQGVLDLLKDAPGTWVAGEIASQALADAILKALSALELPCRESVRFQHLLLAPFELHRAIDAYADLITSVAEEAGS